MYCWTSNKWIGYGRWFQKNFTLFPRYTKLSDVVDHFFPPVHKLPDLRANEFNQVQYWREPLPEISHVEIENIRSGKSSHSSTPEPQAASWRFSHMNAQHLKGKQRLRYNSAPPLWAPGSEQILTSHNSIDLYDGFVENSSDSELDSFDDVGMQSNLSSNKPRTRKSTSVWTMPFVVSNIFF